MSLDLNSLGRQFIAAIITDGKTGSYFKLGPCAYLFQYASQAEKDLYTQFSDFMKKYGKIPSKETFEKEIDSVLPDVKEPPQYYKDGLHERHLQRVMTSSSQEASDKLKVKDVQGAFDILKKMVHDETMNRLGPNLYDFRFSHDMVMHSINSKFSPLEKEGLDFGWPTFDEMSGGLRGGDLISFVGRPAVGKSYFSLFSALHAWEKQKKVIVFVSMEMAAIRVFERLSSMYTHIPALWLKTGGFPTLHTNEKAKFSAAIKELECVENPFYVIDAQLAGAVEDIATLCHQLKPDAVFVDGAYILEVPGHRGSKHEKIGEIARGLKKMATECDIPCIASWQFNRESKKSNNVGVEHISGADEIGQLSSIVLGLFEEDSVSTMQKRKINIIKGREGEAGQILVNWQFDKMDFSEMKPDYNFELV